MRIEDEIKQRSFKSDYHKLVVNLLFTHGWLISLQRGFFEKYNITAAQYNILRILKGQYPSPLSVNLLKNRMLDKMSDTSRLVERLRNKELVVRKTCKQDRRKSDVKITEKGLNLLATLEPVDSEVENNLKSLNLNEIKILNDLLDKLRS